MTLLEYRDMLTRLRSDSEFLSDQAHRKRRWAAANYYRGKAAAFQEAWGQISHLNVDAKDKDDALQ